MGSKLKKAAPWIAGIILVWYAYSAVDAGASGPKDLKESLLHIPHEVMNSKPHEGPTEFENDPFFIEWSPYGPTYDPVYIAARKREAEDKAKLAKAEAARKLLAERAAREKKQEEERQARIKADAEARKKAEAEAPGGSLGFEPFYLTLESVLATSEFAVARVSGLNVEVGDTLGRFDARKPPKVVEIRGTRVTVVHRGERYVLDLLGKTQIAVGGTPRDAPAATQSSGTTRPKKKSAVSGSSGGRRPRPGSLKKPPKKSAVTGK